MDISHCVKTFDGARVCITGGLGMIGSTLAHYLHDMGAQIVILDAMLPQYGGNWFNVVDIKDDIEVVIGDVRDRALVEEIVRGQDFIFNLAAQVSYQDSINDPFLDLEINGVGHLNVLEACRHHNRDAILVFPGSRLQYGRIESVPTNENHPQRPLLIYAVHKLAGERYYQLYFEHFGIRSVALRIANPYGPCQQMKHSKYGILNWFIRVAMDGQTIKVFGDGTQIRDYIYVDDVATAMIAAASCKDAMGEIFNVGSGMGTKFGDMAGMVVDAVGKGTVVHIPWPQDYFNVETGDFVADISKIRNLTGWFPQTTLEQGIKRTVKYYRKYRDMYW